MVNDMDFKLRLHHIAYATKSTDKSIEVFKYIYPNIIRYKKLEKTQKIFYTYISNNNDTHKIELIEPAGNNSPVDNILGDKETILYHVCYEVSDFEKGKEYLKKRGYFMTTKPFEPEHEPGKIVCHFYNPYIGIVEILSEKENGL